MQIYMNKIKKCDKVKKSIIKELIKQKKIKGKKNEKSQYVKIFRSNRRG